MRLKVLFKKSFHKDYRKLSRKNREVFQRNLLILQKYPYCKTLRRHSLKGKYYGLESINITPDLRALFIEKDGVIAFYYIKNHNQLY